MGKGTDILAADTAEIVNWGELDKYGGWGLNLLDYAVPQDFSFDYSIFSGIIDFNDNPLSFTQWPMTPAMAFQLTTDEIRQAPFFRRFNTEHGHDVLYGPKSNLLGSDVVDPLLPHLRGHAIPALSDAAGRNSISDLGDNNFDMSAFRNGWPIERTPDNSSGGVARWKHGDLKDVAYLYVYRLYADFVRKVAKLNQ